MHNQNLNSVVKNGVNGKDSYLFSIFSSGFMQDPEGREARDVSLQKAEEIESDSSQLFKFLERHFRLD